MPTYVGIECEHVSQDVSVIRKCSTQNVRSAIMADSSSTVASNTIGRMILLLVLVWGYCLTGCEGLLYGPAAVSKTAESTNSLRFITQVSDREVSDSKLSPWGITPLEAFFWTDKRLDTRSSRLGHRNHDRESSLEKLLEHLINLQQSHVAKRLPADSRKASDSAEDRIFRHDAIDDLSTDLLFPQTQYRYEPGDPDKSFSRMPIEAGDLHIVSQIDTIESSPQEMHMQPSSSDHATQTHKQTYIENILSSLDKHVPVSPGDTLKGFTTYTDDTDVTKETPEKIHAEVIGESGDNNLKRVSTVYQNNYPRYFIIPDNMVPSASGNNTLSVKDTDIDDKTADFIDDSENSEDIPFKGVQPAADAGLTNKHARTINSAYIPGEDVRYTNQALLVDSLIHKTVKQMEGIINKRVSKYNNILDSDSTETPQDIVLTQRDTNTDNRHRSVGSRTYVSASLEKAGSVNGVTSNDDLEDDNKDHKRLSKTQLEDEEVDEVTAAVMQAVASHTVPRDAQFWMNVSTYLDSSDYLSRTRRSPSRSRKRKGPHYVHLSITYGHVMPCEYKDRFYCMNGGTCVFVGALDIKTCRCPIGYTGVRCEMIDQEYILSLLTNTLIFS